MSNIVILIASFNLYTHFSFAQSIVLNYDVLLSPVAQLNHQHISNDIDILIATLDKAYGGKGILIGSQYNNLISGLKNLKENQGVISSEELCDEIAKLTENVNDNHLTLQIDNKLCQRRWPMANVGPNSGHQSSNPTWSLSFKQFKDHSIPVLSILKMTLSTSLEWNGFLETVQNLVQTQKAFVIDMRRNPGGDSTKGLQMAAVSKVKEVPIPAKQIIRQHSPEAFALLANVSWLNMQSLRAANKSIPIYLINNYQALIQYREKALNGLIPPLEVQRIEQEKIDLKHAIRVPVYVLIDRHCGSSCELTLEALEGLPAIQTVGENTTGIVQYGNVGALYLPSSHIVIRIPTQGSIYDDQRTIEKIGYAPDWKVPLGTDALDYTLSKFFAE